MAKRLSGDERLKKAAARNAAKEAGLLRFFWVCETHGEEVHYTSSGACKRCIAEKKDPAKQAAYWLRVRHKYVPSATAPSASSE